MRGWRVTVVVAAIVLAAFAAVPASAAGGDLDMTFHGNGKVQTGFGTSVFGSAVGMSADGTIVVGGTSVTSTTTRMAVMRYLSDGRLDPAFSSDGKAAAGFSGGASANDIAIQPDGSIVAVGSAHELAQSAFAVVRFDRTGAPDATFSGDGRVTTSLAYGWAQAQAVALQPDGKIVVVGKADLADHRGEAAVVRYLTDGTLDPAFGTGGVVLTPLPPSREGSFWPEDVVLQPDGKILVVGRTSSELLVLARYLPDGRLDPTFGGAGGLKFSGGTEKEGFAIALQSDGRIVITGVERQWNQATNEQDEWFIVGRFLPDGRPDPAFGDRGIVRVSPDGTGNDVAIAPDDSILVAADFSSTERTVGGRFTVIRLSPGGVLDTSFSGDGIAWTTFEASVWSDATGVAIQPDGRVVVSGSASYGSADKVAVARFLAA